MLVLLVNGLFRSEKGLGFVDVAPIVEKNGSACFCAWLIAEKGVVVDVTVVVFNAPNLKLVAAGGFDSYANKLKISFNFDSNCSK